MSLHLPPPPNFAKDEETDSGSSEADDDDQNWDDWASDSLIKAPCQSLFDGKILPSVEEALAYDKASHGFDLNDVCSKLSLDFHGRIRLINYIRKSKPTPGSLSLLKGDETFLASDEYLIPALEDDPLLQIQSGDWSDSDDEDAKLVDPARRVQTLERKLAAAQRDFAEYRALVSRKLNATGLLDGSSEPGPSQVAAPLPVRDDDSHYFKSYGENDIHAVMIQDKVRTSTYAYFILTNPALFRDAIVLDVGCGTGILSLFAARSGAKRVIAVDASDIAEKAELIVKANGFEDIITVIQGKVEEISLPDDIDKVDIIISEWMGYALLYESMLDSVLHARDRFLRSNGVMAPSQCKMQLGLCDASEIFKDRIGFWNDVYGFDLSAMADDLYDEAIVDVVGPNTMLSEPYTVKDLILSEVTPRQLDFSSSFTLVSTTERRTKINSFILYFDTFFTRNGHPVPSSTSVKLIKEGELVLAELWPVGGKPAPQRRKSHGVDKESITSFSTGPQSVPTHWKQTLFLLREPISVEEGSIVHGTFHCRKSEDNSRELDVEIHYSVKEDSESPASDLIVQMYKVR
ncbi:Protein arginine N-methyltransferase 3 [Hypsizygus marmoreus]|uniref:type I protein arginine methyltransferase n=1 Tax=Hypsizygus marmoreus TaxID=39966 RepID=A0A369J5V7_HYPMA|nr:Protein arginine N-methyltransferase 3 [Hypsizygus marmoreus]